MKKFIIIFILIFSFSIINAEEESKKYTCPQNSKGSVTGMVNMLNAVDEWLVQKPLKLLIATATVSNFTDEKIEVKIGDETKEVAGPLKALKIDEVKKTTRNIGLSIVGMFVLFSFLSRGLEVEQFDYMCILPITIKAGIVAAFIISSDTVLSFFNAIALDIANTMLPTELSNVGSVEIKESNLLLLVIIFLLCFLSTILITGVIFFLFGKVLLKVVKLLVMSILLPIYLSLFAFEKTADIGKGFLKNIFTINLELILIFVIILIFQNLGDFLKPLLPSTEGHVLSFALLSIVQGITLLVIINSYDKFVDSINA